MMVDSIDVDAEYHDEHPNVKVLESGERKNVFDMSWEEWDTYCEGNDFLLIRGGVAYAKSKSREALLRFLRTAFNAGGKLEGVEQQGFGIHPSAKLTRDASEFVTKSRESMRSNL